MTKNLIYTPEFVFKSLIFLVLTFYGYSIITTCFDFSFFCSIFIFLLLIAIIYFTSKSVHNLFQAACLIFIISLGIIAFWDHIYKSIPVSDYAVLVDSAKDIVNGTFKEKSCDVSNYFYFYNYQIGYSFYLAFWIKLFGTSLRTLKIIEAVTMSLTNVVFLFTLKKMFTIEKAFFGALLFSLFVPNIMGACIINNQHPAMLFGAIALCLFVNSNNKILRFVFSGICLAIAQILRPSSLLIFLGTIVFCIILVVFKKIQWNRNLIFNFILMVAAYIFFYYGINWVLIKINFAPNGITGSINPYFKFLLGLTGNGLTGHQTVDAEHTQVYFDLQSFHFNYQQYNQVCLQRIIGLIRDNPKAILKFICEKIKYFAGGYDNQYVYTGLENQACSSLKDRLIPFGQAMYFFSVLFSLFSLKKSMSRNSALFFLIFSLYFIAHIFIEVQSRYRYEQYYMLFLLSAPIMYNMEERASDYCKNQLFLFTMVKNRAKSKGMSTKVYINDLIEKDLPKKDRNIYHNKLNRKSNCKAKNEITQ